MKVPFADLRAQHRTIEHELWDALHRVVDESAFIRGPYVDAFEAEFGARVGVGHCVSCANGTDGLFVALKALEVQPGDEVITTAHSWISTSETITLAGARVVFCDTDRRTFTIDPADIERKITPRTRGVVPVHLYGHPADMAAIMDIAARHGLWVLEDCAQAHLATDQGRQVGTFGRAAAYSFYPGKNLGALGDAGAIVTDDGDLAVRMAMFARHGGLRKGEHLIEGINSRMDGLQAAALSVKLRHLDTWTAARQRVALRYREGLAGLPGIDVPEVRGGCEHVYHLYVLLIAAGRDDLRKHLAAQGIETNINYPVILPLLPAYRHLGHRPEDFPVASAHQSQILSLPIFPEMTDEMIDEVVLAVRSWHHP